MFSGIVEVLGQISWVREENAGKRFRIVWPALPENDPFQIGESIAVNGCCLTVVAAEGVAFEVQAGPETLDRTNLNAMGLGDLVNLERALRLGDRLGGHFVQGHVDTTAALVERVQDGEWEFLRFRLDEPRWMRLMVEKGSIAVDGVSLTLMDVDADSFRVMLIPHTLAVTTLGHRQIGERVNIETDMLARHVQRLMAPLSPAEEGTASCSSSPIEE